MSVIHLGSPQEVYDEKMSSIRVSRNNLREQLLQRLITHGDVQKVYYAEFSGYGDSGDVFVDLQKSHYLHEDIVKIMNNFVHSYAEFDWYNNEGGGGDLSWDITSDKVTITAFYNVVSQEYILYEDEF